MPRRPRAFVPQISAHIIQRGNNRLPIFKSGDDYQAFIELLRISSERHTVAIHAYALMTNHYHLLATPTELQSIPQMMKSLNQRYVYYYNHRHARIGTLWNGKYRGIAIHDERYWLTCLRYIEQNPARAGMTEDLATYPWSSYRFHSAPNEELGWLAPHPIFLALGRSERERRAAYRAISGVMVNRGEALPVL